MKTTSSIPSLWCVTLLAIAAAPALSGAPPKSPAVAHPGEQSGPFGQRFAVGASRATVLDQLGLPSAVIGENCWFYWNFKMNARVVKPSYDTLHVQFDDGKVTSIRLVDTAAVHAYLAQRPIKSAGVVVAQSAPRQSATTPAARTAAQPAVTHIAPAAAKKSAPAVGNE